MFLLKQNINFKIKMYNWGCGHFFVEIYCYSPKPELPKEKAGSQRFSQQTYCYSEGMILINSLAVKIFAGSLNALKININITSLLFYYNIWNKKIRD